MFSTSPAMMTSSNQEWIYDALMLLLLARRSKNIAKQQLPQWQQQILSSSILISKCSNVLPNGVADLLLFQPNNSTSIFKDLLWQLQCLMQYPTEFDFQLCQCWYSKGILRYSGTFGKLLELVPPTVAIENLCGTKLYLSEIPLNFKSTHQRLVGLTGPLLWVVLHPFWVYHHYHHHKIILFQLLLLLLLLFSKHLWVVVDFW
jgi:hypothetical protein